MRRPGVQGDDRSNPTHTDKLLDDNSSTLLDRMDGAGMQTTLLEAQMLIHCADSLRAEQFLDGMPRASGSELQHAGLAFGWT